MKKILFTSLLLSLTMVSCSHLSGKKCCKTSCDEKKTSQCPVDKKSADKKSCCDKSEKSKES